MACKNNSCCEFLEIYGGEDFMKDNKTHYCQGDKEKFCIRKIILEAFEKNASPHLAPYGAYVSSNHRKEQVNTNYRIPDGLTKIQLEHGIKMLEDSKHTIEDKLTLLTLTNLIREAKKKVVAM